MKRIFCTLPYSRFALVLVLALSILFVVVFASPASAQEAEAVSAPPETATSAPIETAPSDGKMPWERVTEAPVEAEVPAPAAEAAYEEAPAEATETAEEAVEAPAEAVETAAETPAPAPETAPIVETAAEAPAPDPAQKTEKVKKVKEPKAPKEPKEPSDGSVFRLGVRAAFGASGFHKHKALVDERDRNKRAIVMKPAVAASGGLASAFVFGGVFSLAVEGQYSLYRAHGEFVEEAKGKDYRNLYTAGVFLHAAELPVLARFHINPVYIEAGASPGANVYSHIYKGNEQYKPIPEYFACGAVFGFGFEIENVLVGVRGHYGFLEYDKNLTGYPWSAQVSVTKFFLN